MKKTVLIIILTMLLLIAAPATAGYLRADINGDGRVDLGDLAIMMKEWLMSEPILTVTGVGLDPDIRGDYEESGVYGGLTAYKHVSKEWYIWWHDFQFMWFISTEKGITSGAIWGNGDENVVGTFLPNPIEGSVGTATVAEYVAADETAKVMRTRRSRMVIR